MFPHLWNVLHLLTLKVDHVQNPVRSEWMKSSGQHRLPRHLGSAWDGCLPDSVTLSLVTQLHELGEQSAYKSYRSVRERCHSYMILKYIAILLVCTRTTCQWQLQTLILTSVVVKHAGLVKTWLISVHTFCFSCKTVCFIWWNSLQEAQHVPVFATFSDFSGSPAERKKFPV